MSLFKPVEIGGVKVDPNAMSVGGRNNFSAVLRVWANGATLTRREVEQLRDVLTEVLER